MSNPAPLFSNLEYYKNKQFQRLMRNWNKYITYDGKDVNNEDLMFEWEELLLKDFLNESRIWFDRWGDQILWRIGLE